MKTSTPKHFVLQLASLISLYLSVTFLLVVLFGLIELVIPDSSDSYYMIADQDSSVRLGIAMLVVFFPTYLLLTRSVNKLRRSESNEAYLGFTKWIVYLSLLVAGGTLLIDLVTVIMSFLEGELTTRFLLKALSVIVVVGLAFFYYILDIRGYWLKNEKQSWLVAALASLVVVVSIGFGFSQIASPAEVRESKIDERQVQDLQQIQNQIENYYFSSNQLPESLEDLPTVPTAPENREAYQYQLTDRGFSLCATFATTSNQDEERYYFDRPASPDMLLVNPWDWSHEEGDTCFDRIINPEFKTTTDS